MENPVKLDPIDGWPQINLADAAADNVVSQWPSSPQNWRDTNRLRYHARWGGPVGLQGPHWHSRLLGADSASAWESKSSKLNRHGRWFHYPSCIDSDISSTTLAGGAMALAGDQRIPTPAPSTSTSSMSISAEPISLATAYKENWATNAQRTCNFLIV